MYDLIIQNGLIVDGTRRKPYRASLCIQDGRIARIAQESISKFFPQCQVIPVPVADRKSTRLNSSHT